MYHQCLRSSAVALRNLHFCPLRLDSHKIGRFSERLRDRCLSGTSHSSQQQASRVGTAYAEVEQLVLDLAQQLPCFSARQQDFEIIRHPVNFYQALLTLIRQARRRIFIASLYVGKEEHELLNALYQSLKSNHTLRLTIVVDYLRSTREDPKPSSASLLATLKANFPNQVEVALYHTSELYGWQKKAIPRRFDEGWGLQHMKIYGADDNLIMSGANLSRDYFTNRMDRYIKVCNHAALADYYYELCTTTARLSYLLDSRSTSSRLSISWSDHNLIQAPDHSKSASLEFKAAGHRMYQALTTKWQAHTVMSQETRSDEHDTYILPVIQMGPFDIYQETQLVVPRLIHLGSTLASSYQKSDTRLDWTSGYFSLLREYKRSLLQSNLNVQMIAASPEANGFFQSKGVSRYIPPAYTYLEMLFYNDIVSAGKQDQIEIREWRQPGWTYHAKGIWLSTCPDTPTPSSPSTNSTYSDLLRHSTLRPCLTLIGSSNYGRRSAERDLEANLLIINHNTQGGFSTQLAHELSGLKESAIDVVNWELLNRADRKVGIGVKLATHVIRNML
ncbi:hypothetical protein CROQUDRAFT_71298 [Cronartium quercuum f. sp. fusiforme G11]|uniref:CDP-diacylglycerol--glycerol-3-phosphate 3-phosphatidyltransferase n=1 Tax=Cronartium quercuum f. sp. fusiforme G11 TaxID=708437 RepID=A0A9P6NTJ4_9BASI|nr:hypothetical protein CROQUDRAFT_71298 [Cronartium quercuum f. sp. fusiforme G11]